MNVNEILEELQVGKKTVFDLKKEIGEGGVPQSVLTVSVKDEAPLKPIRAESKRRRHVFYDVASFAAYLTKYGNPDTVIFGNPQTGIVNAVLDETIIDGFETIRFEPMLHPLWRPWEAMLANGSLPLEAFVDFIAKNRRSVFRPAGPDLLMMFSQIRAAKHIELQRGKGKRAVNGLMVTTEIQGIADKEAVELPDSIEIYLPIFVRTSKRTINIDLTIGIDDQDIKVTLAAADLIEAKFAAFEEMFQQLTALKEMTLTLGDPAHAEWDYLKK